MERVQLPVYTYEHAMLIYINTGPILQYHIVLYYTHYIMEKGLGGIRFQCNSMCPINHKAAYTCRRCGSLHGPYADLCGA